MSTMRKCVSCKTKLTADHYRLLKSGAAASRCRLCERTKADVVAQHHGMLAKTARVLKQLTDAVNTINRMREEMAEMREEMADMEDRVACHDRNCADWKTQSKRDEKTAHEISTLKQMLKDKTAEARRLRKNERKRLKKSIKPKPSPMSKPLVSPPGGALVYEESKELEVDEVVGPM